MEGSGFLDLPSRIVSDLALTGATVYLSHNPLEFVVIRLAANAATHVGLDIIGAAAKRIRHFRPSGTILAV